MASLVQIFNEWEIQMLVLLSFMLQAFLFFGGGLRQRTKNGFLRILVWIAYLGADLVAAYALGLISRQDDATPAGKDLDRSMGTHRLAVMWVPFLLIHLGGQDTITGFSLEDNNLWRRHLLNLVVQVGLALYIFWKSANGPSKKFLVPSILLFVTGTIKYGERTWALRSGVLRSLSDFGLPPYATKLRKTIMESRPFGEEDYNKLLEQIGRDDSSSGATVLSIALCSIDSTLSFLWHDDTCNPVLHMWVNERGDLLPKVLEILEIELGLVYDYIYTKAVVFQTKGGIILRCISQASFVASFVVFLVSNKQRYNSIDTAVTYALFAGGFGLEVCGVCTTVRSPWTWAWLETRQHCGFLASVIMRWQRKQVLWSNSMGQYSLHNYLGQGSDHHESSSWKQRVLMPVTRKAVDAVCGAEQKFWISNQLDTMFVKVDKEMIWCVFQQVIEFKTGLPQQWPNLGAFLQKLLPTRDGTLNWITIAVLHTYTQAQLRAYSRSRGDVGDDATSIFVRKLSRYMVYLLVTQTEMLPLSKDVNSRILGIARYFAKAGAKIGNNTDSDDDPFLREIMVTLGVPVPSCCTIDELLEIKEAWVRLLIYIAGRSRPEMHAAQVAKGGELLTFVWLFMAFKFLGDSVYTRIDVYEDDHVEFPARRHYALFRLPPVQAGVDSSPVAEKARTALMEFLMDES